MLQGLVRQRAIEPFGEALLVGVDFIGLFNRVHVQIAVAGFSARGAPVTAPAKEAGAEGEGGMRGNMGILEGGGVWEGFAIEGEEKGVGGNLGILEEGGFELEEG